MSTMLTECINCGASAHLTDLETLEWMKGHGPGKCHREPVDDLCGLDACAIGGFCQARSDCEFLEDGDAS